MADKKWVPAPTLFSQFLDDDGKPLSNGRLYTYRSSTNELKATYKDPFGVAVNENPIKLDDEGSCLLFIDSESEDAYRFELRDMNDAFVKNIDGVVAIKGKDGKPYEVILVRGKQGKDGEKGQSVPGPVTKGDKGDTSKSGDFIVFYDKAGTFTYTHAQDAEPKVRLKMIGGGGGFLRNTVLPDVGQGVTTGGKGEYTETEITLNPGDSITIKIGDGGQISENPNLAAGQPTSVEGDNITKITVNGGFHGTTYKDNYNNTAKAFQKMEPYISFTLYDGRTISKIPRAIFGESSPFGDGGNIYKYGDPDARGNGSSGGISIPYVLDNNIKVAVLGKGAPGYLELIYTMKEV